MNLANVLTAAEFAIRAHGNQKREGTGEPYVVHSASVARMVAAAGYPEPVVIGALLHDVVEDTKVKAGEILTTFGSEVCRLVMEVSQVSLPLDGDRAARKALDNQHFAKASAEGQSIKLSDILDNARTIYGKGNAFAKIWFLEKRALLAIMTRGHSGLYYEARRAIDEYFETEARKGHEQKA